MLLLLIKIAKYFLRKDIKPNVSVVKRQTKISWWLYKEYDSWKIMITELLKSFESVILLLEFTLTEAIQK